MSQIASLLIIPLALTLLIYSDSFMQFFLHKQELQENEAFLLAVIVVGTMMNSLMYLPIALLLASGKTGKLLLINVISILFFLPGVIYLVPIYGIMAAAWIWFLLNLGYIAIGSIYIFREYPEFRKINWYFSDLLVPIMISGTVLLSMKFLFGDIHNLFFVGFAFVLAAVASLLSLGRLRNQLFILIKGLSA
jgi:O-antigen/teichoic acid export membrane protein